MALPSQAKPALQVTNLDDISLATEKVELSRNDAFSHLPEDEAAILRRQIESPAAAKVTWRTLFRFASRQDLLVIAVSSLCAIAAGAAVPLNTIIMGSLAGAFQDFMSGSPRAELDTRVARQALFFVYLAIGEFLAIYVATVGFKYAGESITRKTREKYLLALMNQNTAYFDKLGPGEIITRITADTNVIQEGISEKLELLFSSVSMFFTAYIVGFIRYWKLTLILASLTPTFFVIGKVLGNRIVKYSKLSSAAHAEGGNLVEETFSSIRTVTGCGIQENLAKEYNKCLTRAEAFGLRMKCVAGSGPGFTICIFNLGYALASWMGSRYIAAGETTLSAVVTILLVMMLGAFALVKASQHIQAFANAVASAAGIYATIDRIPQGNEHYIQRNTLEVLEGRIEFKGTKFIYPSRPDVVVLGSLNLTVPAGKTLAITGSSGSGKSTIIALIERFYNPVAGEVLIDGLSIGNLDPRWLRQQIGLVSQDPILFSTTVEENILHGLREEELQQLTDCHSKRAMAEKAAKLANAHDFISLLPQGYETQVGERGSLLSGGQRQRIAIARAVVGDPRILLFDEATSALDSKSEGVVQAALEHAAKGRTTIVISHRMSTIRNADSIVVMGPGGEILEQGTYEELFATKSAFFHLVGAQNMVPDSKRTLDGYFPGDGRTDISISETSLALKDPASTGPKEKSTEVGASPNNKSQHGPASYSLWSLIKFTASLNQQEWKAMLVGVVASIIAGAGEPVQCIILAQSVATLALPPSQYQRLRSDADFWSGMFVMIAFVMLGCFLVLGVAFAYGSERLVHRGRDRAFRSILRQDIQFFDRSENSVGALTSFLSTETTHLAGMSGLALGTIFQLLATLVIGYIVALAIGWKLALVCIATVPVLLLAGFLSFWSLSRFETYMKDAYRESSTYACEVTSSIQTIASLTLEKEVANRYHGLLVAQQRRNLLFNLKSSVFHAAGQSLGFLCMALCFWYGSSLLGDYSISQFYLVFFLVIFGTRSAANMFSLAPNMAKARVAAAELKGLFERVPAIDVWSSDGHILQDIQGSVEFQNVDFSYQAGSPVLNGLNFSIMAGQYVAFVGASGCGKSTIIALLERFYDPTSGAVYIDGRSISTLNLKEYRQHLALVSQEPTLYQGTIRDNILLAVDKHNISEEQVVKVCKQANIYDFISSLPAGFETVIGSKGSMLSGGQKQRIAIARALLRDPKILLLDEATSALDSDSETVVQATLDAAARGRTTIAVAHRLSTVRNADTIFVVDTGQVVESGNHEALMAQRGRYFEMVQLQSVEKEKEN